MLLSYHYHTYFEFVYIRLVSLSYFLVLVLQTMQATFYSPKALSSVAYSGASLVHREY